MLAMQPLPVGMPGEHELSVSTKRIGKFGTDAPVFLSLFATVFYGSVQADNHISGCRTQAMVAYGLTVFSSVWSGFIVRAGSGHWLGRLHCGGAFRRLVFWTTRVGFGWEGHVCFW
jgi:hypothetical protein